MFFSEANSKIKKLSTVTSLSQYLSDGRKVYSFDILSGWSCPYANDCLSKVTVDSNGKKTIKDGSFTKFRCFSASQEVAFPAVYNRRAANFEAVKNCTAENIAGAIPNDAGIIRIHVGGDFFNQRYFDNWLEVARAKKDTLFYAYTKSLPFLVKRIDDMPDNFVITASLGGRRDDLIKQYNLKHAVVVFSEKEAADLNLEIDHDDSHAADKTKGTFALLLHGLQPKGSEASVALKELKLSGTKFSYGKKS